MPSSVIRAFHYDEPERRLEITFVTGRKYIYREVPAEMYARLRASFSKGEFFNAHVRGRYAYERVGAFAGKVL